MKLPVIIFLVCCFVIAAAAVTYMFLLVRKRSYISSIYKSSVRDYRFAYALMKSYYKKSVMRGVYLLKNSDGVSPRADVVAVLKGGIVVITVVDKKGFFVTPADGPWTLTDNDGVTTEIPNSLKIGKRYVSEIENLLIKAGIPAEDIYNIVLLSDDRAKFDEIYSDNILTGDMLIPFCQKICRNPSINGKTRKSIMYAIAKRHKSCKSYAEKNIYNTLSFSEKEPSLPDLMPSPDDLLTDLDLDDENSENET